MNDTISEEELQFLLASWLAKRLFRGFCPDAGLEGLKRGLRSENVTDSTLIILYFFIEINMILSGSHSVAKYLCINGR